MTDVAVPLTSVLTPGSAELRDPILVGHKFARQEMLRDEGFRVPPFACVPSTVFDELAGPVVREVLAAAGTGDPTAPARELRERIRAITVPDALAGQLLDRFDELAGPDGVVAVRACVAADATGAGEDSEQQAHAGLSDSFLHVRRSDVVARVRDCWASAFNDEAVLYRGRIGEDPWSARTAVGVQAMVTGARSFVAFTRDPRDGSRRCVVAAAYGSGEGVVAERADVDHVVVDRDTGSVERETVHKRRSTAPADGGGITVVDVPAELADQPVLDDALVREIVATAERIEEVFGRPQDIEGTVTAGGEVHVVQSRPITGLNTVPDAPADPIPWGNSNVTESFPGVSCALTFSMARTLYETGFADFYRRMGVPERALSGNRHRLARMIGHLDGRIYYRLDSWYHLHGQLRSFDAIRPTWEQAMGLAAGTSGRRRRPGRVRTALNAVELAVRAAGHRRRVRAFLTWWDALHARHADLDGRAPHELVDAYRDLWRQVGQWWGVTLVNGELLMNTTRATTALLERWAPGGDRGVLNGMLCGGPEHRSAAAMRSMVELAELAVATGARHLLAAPGDDDATLRRRFDELQRSPEHRALADAVAVHVRRYGDRGLQDLKLEAATPRTEPWTVLRLLAPYADGGLSADANRAGEQKVRREAERELAARCPNRLRRTVLRALFRAMRRLVVVREDTRFARSELVGDSRELLTRLGRELARAGHLDDGRDVLDLTVEEVLGAYEGTLPAADLRALAAVRAATRRDAAGRPAMPSRIDTDPDRPVAAAGETRADPAAAPEGDTGDALRGLGSSSGVVRGRAKVVVDPADAGDDCADAILVARETDPGWLYLMLAARGMVVERGTLLSHTAITGRQLGIPTVVAVPGATTRIPDGALVEVDGGAGTVRVLDGVPS